MSLWGGLSLSLQEPSETLWLLWKPQPQISEEGILSVQVTDVRAGSFLVVRAPLVHCRFRSIPGVYLLDANSTLPLSGTTSSVSRRCQMSPGGPKSASGFLQCSGLLVHSTGS